VHAFDGFFGFLRFQGLMTAHGTLEGVIGIERHLTSGFLALVEICCMPQRFSSGMITAFDVHWLVVFVFLIAAICLAMVLRRLLLLELRVILCEACSGHCRFLVCLLGPDRPGGVYALQYKGLYLAYRCS